MSQLVLGANSALTKWVASNQTSLRDVYGRHDGAVTLHINREDLTGELGVALVSPYTAVIKFKIASYPSCCAMGHLHDFSHSARVTPELMASFLDVFFNSTEIRWPYFFSKNKRVIVAMVEHRPWPTEEALDSEGDPYDKPIYPDPWDELEPVPNPRIDYKEFYNYFHKQKKCKTTSIFFNGNSGNVIHLLEVVLN